jgi:hypothetical protein
VPEALLVEVHAEHARKFAMKYLVALGTVLSLLLVAMKLLKGIFKFALAALAIAALVYGVHCWRNDMLMEKIQSIKSEEVTGWLRENKEWIEGAASSIINIEEIKNGF